MVLALPLLTICASTTTPLARTWCARGHSFRGQAKDTGARRDGPTDFAIVDDLGSVDAETLCVAETLRAHRVTAFRRAGEWTRERDTAIFPTTVPLLMIVG
jgi:hypothetical protein